MIKFLKTLFAKLKERKKKKKKIDADRLCKENPGLRVKKVSNNMYRIDSDQELSIEQIQDIIKKHIEGD